MNDPIPILTRAQASACLAPEHFDRSMGIALDGIQQLRDQQRELSQHIEDAVAAGIRRAVADPEMWEAAGQAMRTQAQSTAGGWLLGGIGQVIKRIALIAAVLLAVYALGGWGAVVALLKTTGGGH